MENSGQETPSLIAGAELVGAAGLEPATLSLEG